MPNNIDRELQLKLLSGLSGAYPDRYDFRRIVDLAPQGTPANKITSNLKYLEDHGLVALTVFNDISRGMQVVSANITAKGLDFLADDGGLTAVLGVVTVKLHADTIKDLVIAKIQSSEAKPSVKEDLISTIKKLPARGLEKLLFAGFEKGIGAVPNVVEWAKNMLS
ncbi:unnamed protein product [Bartonella apis]|uniref:hypothetical protein n=1 Tax=Bartonella apis TaxID=1686310 RepID=UPI0039991ABD